MILTLLSMTSALTYLEVASLRLNFLQPGVDHLQRVGTRDGVDQEEGVPCVTFLISFDTLTELSLRILRHYKPIVIQDFLPSIPSGSKEKVNKGINLNLS